MSVARDTKWRAIVAALAIAAAIVAAYRATFGSMVALWDHGTYGHCALIAPLAAWLVYGRLDRLRSAVFRPSFGGAAAVLAALAAWHVGRAASVQVLEHAAAIALIPAMVWMVLGSAVHAPMAAGLWFLLAAVPIGDELIPVLMRWTGDVAVTLLNVSGMPVFREGMIFELPSGRFEVADVCSGLNFLLVGVKVSLFFALLTFRAVWRRAAFVIIAIGVLLVANGVRAFVVMYVGSSSDMRVMVGRDHVIFGEALFAGIMVVMCLVGRRWADRAEGQGGGMVPRADASRVVPTGTPVVAYAVAGGAMLVALLAPSMHPSGPDAVGPDEAFALPSLPGCDGPVAWDAKFAPTWHAADAELRGTYACPSARLHVVMVEYRSQAQSEGKELTSSLNHAVPVAWRRTAAFDTRDLATPPVQLRVNEVRYRDDARQYVSWYWYSVDGSMTASSLGAKARELVAAVFLRSPRSRAYTLTLETSATPAEAQVRALSDAARRLSVAEHGA